MILRREQYIKQNDIYKYIYWTGMINNTNILRPEHPTNLA